MKYTEPERDFPHDLSRLSWADLHHLAKFHSRLAETCLKRAQRLREIDLMQQSTKERVNGLEASYKVVLAYLDKGYNSIESAVAAAARQLDLHEETVMGWWKIFVRNRDRAAREERDRAVVGLVNIGLNNYEIAARFGISENTISRIITGYLHGALRPCDRARLRKRRKVQA